MNADVDLGSASDDLNGSDTLRSACFVYNNGADDEYGINPPAIFINVLATPHAFIPGKTFIDINGNEIFEQGIDIPLDSAKFNQGGTIGTRYIPGAMNLKMKSHNFFRGLIRVNMPSTAFDVNRYLKGLTRLGTLLDPCNFAYSIFIPIGVPCDQANKFIWVSGDHVSNGWINIISGDTRSMIGVGPFSLRSNEKVEFLAAYLVGRGVSPISSISHARAISDDVSWFYNSNFNSSLISVKEESIRNSSF
ncbi:MAG: hypothetical protein MZV64_03300 [Ignavibacteriales bacterium]|nr:hypothetical protein [Ignavibacteriales bacterium]